MNLLSNLSALNASSVALALSDGTPVEFVKITNKDRIQVRVPSSHDLAQQDDGGADPSLRIFRRDGTHFKDRTSLTLVATSVSAAAPVAAPTPAAAPVANDDNTVYTVDGVDFDNLDDAKQEAIDIFRDTGETIAIFATTRKVIGQVGFVSLAA